jgi:AGZA family xanthine/uracil permease-like MFS transporter
MSAQRFRYRWYGLGDVNAFFALSIDNLALLSGMTAILIGVFHLPAAIVLGRMVPGTAMGVLVGDLIYSGFAFRLAAREQRQDVCAMPFGIDTPAMFALSFGVIGPAYVARHDAELAWQVGMAVLVVMGLAKIIVAFFGEAIRRLVPRAALLGVLSAIAVGLIMFSSIEKLMLEPVGGLVALGVVLLTLVGRVRLPPWLPAVLVAVAAGALALWIASFAGYAAPAHDVPQAALALHLPLPSLAWLGGLGLAWQYVPLALPIALATVVGGIDNTESAMLAGDAYSTRGILLGEGVATLVAALCGGVIQNTPYIGHPAYKAMGARSGYTLACGLFIGLGAASGMISVLIGAVPESLLVPVLVYVGVEMAAQAGLETPKAHARALPFALIPVIAYLVVIKVSGFLGDAGLSIDRLPQTSRASLAALYMLGNGFVVSAMVWVALVVLIIESQLLRAALVCVLAATMTLFGLMHSPFSDGRLFLPDRATPHAVFALAFGYLLVAVACMVMAWQAQGPGRVLKGSFEP